MVFFAQSHTSHFCSTKTVLWLHSQIKKTAPQNKFHSMFGSRSGRFRVESLSCCNSTALHFTSLTWTPKRRLKEAHECQAWIQGCPGTGMDGYNHMKAGNIPGFESSSQKGAYALIIWSDHMHNLWNWYVNAYWCWTPTCLQSGVEICTEKPWPFVLLSSSEDYTSCTKYITDLLSHSVTYRSPVYPTTLYAGTSYPISPNYCTVLGHFFSVCFSLLKSAYVLLSAQWQ